MGQPSGNEDWRQWLIASPMHPSGRKCWSIFCFLLRITELTGVKISCSVQQPTLRSLYCLCLLPYFILPSLSLQLPTITSKINYLHINPILLCEESGIRHTLTSLKSTRSPPQDPQVTSHTLSLGSLPDFIKLCVQISPQRGSPWQCYWK